VLKLGSFYAKTILLHSPFVRSGSDNQTRAGKSHKRTYNKIFAPLAYFVRMTLVSVTSPFRENTSRRRLSSAPLGRFFTHRRDDMSARVAHHQETTGVRSTPLKASVEAGVGLSGGTSIQTWGSPDQIFQHAIWNNPIHNTVYKYKICIQT
jgi:hypothetical protein